jgi:hypothetical protein
MKKLQPNSQYEKYDLNGDGTVSDAEFVMDQQLIELENEDARQDAQRNMAWFALFGMLLYPFAVVLASYVHLDTAAKILGDMAPTYFVSVMGIVAAFYGKEAFASMKSAPTPVYKKTAVPVAQQPAL